MRSSSSSSSSSSPALGWTSSFSSLILSLGDEPPSPGLAPRLLPPPGSPQEAALHKRLADMNALDLELWDFATALVDERARHQRQQRDESSSAGAGSAVGCRRPGGPPPFGRPRRGDQPASTPLAAKLGIHRPPGHKQ